MSTMETGVTVKVYGLEDIKKQAAVVREKMRELDKELEKMERIAKRMLLGMNF